MMARKELIFFSVVFIVLSAKAVVAQDCVECHKTVTPGIVEQWLSGNMSKQYSCEICTAKPTILKMIGKKQQVLVQKPVKHVIQGSTTSMQKDNTTMLG